MQNRPSRTAVPSLVVSTPDLPRSALAEAPSPHVAASEPGWLSRQLTRLVSVQTIHAGGAPLHRARQIAGVSSFLLVWSLLAIAMHIFRGNSAQALISLLPCLGAGAALAVMRLDGREVLGAHITLAGLFVPAVVVALSAGPTIPGPLYVPALVASFAILLTGMRGGLAWALAGIALIVGTRFVEPLMAGVFHSGPLSLSASRGAPLAGLIVVFILASLHDHLYRRSLEEAALARERLSQALAARTAFVANVTHELRTPVAGVVGLCEAMLHTEVDPERRRQLQAMRDSAASLLDVVAGVLDFSSLEMNGFDIHPEAFSLADTLADVTMLLQPIAQKSQLELRSTVEGEMPPQFFGDGQRVRQVLFNIVGNALKFTQAGHVHIVTTLEPVPASADMRVVLRVEDTGPGISKVDQERIFQPFEQADASMHRSVGGTGLGLHISRRIVELMGGSISVESAPGAGTTFHVALVLPVANQDEGTAAIAVMSQPTPRSIHQRVRPLSGAHTYTGRVLIAEDSELNQLVLVAMMQRAQVPYELVANGAEAIERAKTGGYDLVLMDLQMPHVDGLEATAAIRAMDGAAGEVPIVALTATVITEVYGTCMDVGFTEVRQKPLDYPALVDVLTRYVPLAMQHTASRDG